MHQISIHTHAKARGLKGELCHPSTLRARLTRVLKHPHLAEVVPARAALCLTLTTDEEVHALNLEYRGKDKPTDVLSFSLLEGERVWTPPGAPTQLGDIVISLHTAREQAARGALPRLTPALGARPWSLSDEVSFLALHGLLHLLGFDHERDAEAEEMEALELALLPTLLPTLVPTLVPTRAPSAPRSTPRPQGA
jgi:rRNA maturation RNase YbeY